MQPLLDDLRKLQFPRSAKSPLSSQAEFLQWADQVKPRLSFNPKLIDQFSSAVALVDSQRALRLPMDTAINEAIGIVNQAVLELEIKERTSSAASHLSPEQTRLEFPKQLTLKWIWENAHWQVYATFVGALIGAFGLGVWVSDLKFALLQPTAKAATGHSSPVQENLQRPNPPSETAVQVNTASAPK